MNVNARRFPAVPLALRFALVTLGCPPASERPRPPPAAPATVAPTASAAAECAANAVCGAGKRC